jgi:hydrogenase maturation protein HypF
MFHVKRPVLAVGGDIKTSFALAWRDKVFLSPHIGSLGSPAAESFFMETLDRYRKWTGIEPECIACDLHPDYLSTRMAERLAKRGGLALVRVQHHFAHTVSVMAEHGLPGPALGIAVDGTGYGTDGAVWGCELLSVKPDLSWSRLGHLGYLRLGGAGDALADPRRAAKAYLAQSTGAVDKGRGSLTSSLGRLFDAVAAITGVCRSATYEGQAPTALEDVADRHERGDYFSADLLDLSVSPVAIRPEPMVLAVSRETTAGVPAATVAARFHNTVALALARSANELRRVHGLTAICLSGGVWQNRLLRDRFLCCCKNASATYINVAVPPNDGGIALGQAVVAGRSG